MQDKVINDLLLSSQSRPVLDSSNNDKASKNSMVDFPTEKLASPNNLQSLPNKELVTKLNTLEISCMEVKIQHENSWSLIETLLNQLKDKLLEINEELGHANRQLLSQEERIHSLENHVTKIISQPTAVKPTTEANHEGETIHKAENNQALINAIQHQANSLESIKLSISEIFAFNTNQKCIYD
jgi:chromosome segregation ATPase